MTDSEATSQTELGARVEPARERGWVRSAASQAWNFLPYLPIRTWLPKYNLKEYALDDAVAGSFMRFLTIRPVPHNASIFLSKFNQTNHSSELTSMQESLSE